MFFVQFDELVLMKNFWSTLILLTSVLPKWPFFLENGRKIGRNHEITNGRGGCCFEVPGPGIWCRATSSYVFDPPQTVGSYLQWS